MIQKELKVRLSDSRFYYNCTIDNLCSSGFWARNLPGDFDENTSKPIKIILTTNVAITIAVRVSSVCRFERKKGKDIYFQIIDPPKLWKEYVDYVKF